MADYLKIPEVARRLDVSEPTVRRMVKSGKLPSVFVGGAYRVSEGDLEEYLENAKVRPGKAQAPSLERSFNDVLAEERREVIYQPWLDLVNRYAARWEARIDAGDFDLGSLDEFDRVTDELFDVLEPLNRRETRELPPQPFSFGTPKAITGRAIERLLGLLNPMLEAAAKKFPHEVLGDELEPLRRKRDERRRALERGVSGA